MTKPDSKMDSEIRELTDTELDHVAGGGSKPGGTGDGVSGFHVVPTDSKPGAELTVGALMTHDTTPAHGSTGGGT